MPELLKRTVFGALYVLVMVLGIVVYPPLFPPLCLMLIGGAMNEFYTMALGPSDYRLSRFLAVVTMGALFGLLFVTRLVDIGSGWVALALVPFFLMMVSPIFRKDHSDVDKMALVIAGMAYVGLPVALVPFVVCTPDGYSGWLLLCLFAVIWLSDIGAYAVGTLLGQRPESRKLCPSISPKKSWWGLFGAVAFGVGSVFLVRALGQAFCPECCIIASLPWYHCTALGVIVSVGSVLGDLVESLWKRRFGVKDSGNAIPGHGGLYDRFDSSLVAIPLAALYLSLL